MMPPKTITVGAVEPPRLSRDGRTMVVSIPISMRLTGGRKKVVTPANVAPWSPPPARVDNTVVKALARAHRWRSMLESNLFVTVPPERRPRETPQANGRLGGLLRDFEDRQGHFVSAVDLRRYIAGSELVPRSRAF